jgi:hypothetical protein
MCGFEEILVPFIIIPLTYNHTIEHLAIPSPIFISVNGHSISAIQFHHPSRFMLSIKLPT